MKHLITALLFTIPLFVLGAIGINQSNGVVAGEGHARTHDFYVKANTFNLEISDPDSAGVRFVQVSVPVKDIDTGRSLRNIHMRMSILKAKKYPEITFTANTKAPLAPGQITLNGLLTINAIAKTHELTIALVKEAGKLVASGETVILLSDYDLPLVGMGPMKLLNRVEMAFNITIPSND